MSIKHYRSQNVYDAACARVRYVFDHFDKIYISFSGGKDSSVMLHLVMAEALKRQCKVAVLIIDLEAQYKRTIEHLDQMVELYADHIELHWVCVPLLLRNAVTNYEPRWMCWQPGKQDVWVRELPSKANSFRYPFFEPGLEFEEFMVMWGDWYAAGVPTAGFVGIRADESLNRFRTVALQDKAMHGGKRWTTHITDQLFNAYPIYDWKTEDIWRFHAKFPHLPHNGIYDLMQQAGVSLSQQRLCQPYGDDQRKGLWLYHLLEPETWFKLVARVNGANSGAVYIQESGNMTGYNKITCPAGHTWKSFCNLLLQSLPKKTQEHYISRFRSFIKGWRGRGYTDGIPDEAPKVLEDKQWAPSWRRMCKVILRNDHWCKGLGLTQPKSEAYSRFMAIKMDKK